MRTNLVATAALCILGCEGPNAQPSASATASTARTTTSTASSAPKPSAAISTSASAAAPAACELKKKPLYWVGWSPDGKTLVTAASVALPEKAAQEGKPTEDSAIDIWDLERGVRASTHHLGLGSNGDRDPLIAFTPDGKGVVSGGLLGDLMTYPAYWDLAAGTTRFLKDPISFPEDVSIAADGARAIISGGASQLVLFDLPSLKTVGPTPYSEGHAESGVQLTQDGRVIHEFGRSVLMVNPETLKADKSFELGAFAASADGSVLAVFSKDWCGLVDAKGKKLQAFDEAPKLEEGEWSILGASVSPDGKRAVLSGLPKDQMVVWDTATGKKLGAVTAPANTFRPIFSPDSKVMFAREQGFDVASLAPTLTLSPDASPIFVGPGHNLLKLEGEDAQEVDALTGSPTKRSWKLPGMKDAVLRIKRDGSLLAYRPLDKDTVHIVRLADGASLDLGVVSSGKEQQGFVVGGGKYQGPPGARGCGPTPGNPATSDTLLKDFVAGK